MVEPRFGQGNSLSPQNRMTSINININNLDEKKEDHKINVKYHPKEKFAAEEADEDRNFRAEKKRKIR